MKADVSGALADFGVMVPLAAALILVNGLDASAVFVGAGLLVLASGLYFRIPFPVQPLKALTAVAVSQRLAPDVIHAAGLEIAGFLLLLSIGGIANTITKVFTKPVVRALQFGVGVLLVVTSWRLVVEPPDLFRGTPAEPWPLLLALLSFVGVWLAARTKRYEIAIVLLVIGIAVTWSIASPHFVAPAISLPAIDLPARDAFGTAFVLLVVPQLPLTFGNAVVAVTDVAHDAFGARARRVTPRNVCISCGAGNIASALLGGVPMCHGAGGLTAHHRLGAQTMWMNVGLGSAFVLLGLLFAGQVPVLLGLLPVWVLAAMLAYAGIRHAALVADLRSIDLAVAVAAGALGAWRGNLAITLAVGLLYAFATRSSKQEKASALTAR